MSTLFITSAVSMLICIGLTLYASTQTESNGGQSVKDSMIEAWENIFIGFSLNFVANFFILPLVGLDIKPLDNFMIGWIYTAVSMVRSFGIRRYNNNKELKKRVVNG